MFYKKTFHIKDGKITPSTRGNLARPISKLKDGIYEVPSFKQVGKYRNTRYKYYFGHLIKTIVEVVQPMDLDGNPLTADQVHNFFKLKYNPVTIFQDGVAYAIPQSTTRLSDREFINEFEEKIVAEYAHLCVFLTREEYAEMKRNERHDNYNQPTKVYDTNRD